MAALGRVSLETLTTDRLKQDCVLGFEFSGRDLRYLSTHIVSKICTARNYSGRRLMGIVGTGALSTYVADDCTYQWEVTDARTLEEAATIPVVYCTVLYALLVVN